MKQFKVNQYIQLKSPPEGVYGYIVKGYEYINGELYLISGDANIRHHIDDIKDSCKEYILKLIC